MKVSKKQAEEIISDLKPAISAILERHGLDPKFSWKYGDALELKLVASAVEEGPNGVNLGSLEATYFTRYGFTSYSLSMTLSAPLGTLFESRGVVYAFAGIAAKRPKYPIVGRNVKDGSITFFTEAAVITINAAAAKVPV